MLAGPSCEAGRRVFLRTIKDLSSLANILGLVAKQRSQFQQDLSKTSGHLESYLIRAHGLVLAPHATCRRGADPTLTSGRLVQEQGGRVVAMWPVESMVDTTEDWVQSVWTCMAAKSLVFNQENAHCRFL